MRNLIIVMMVVMGLGCGADGASAQTASGDRIDLIFNPGDARRQRHLFTTNPDQTIHLGRGEKLLALYPDGGSAEFSGPFTGPLSQARRREMAAQSFGARLVGYLLQARNSARRADTRDPAAGPVTPRPSATAPDDLPPISITAIGPQCIVPGRPIRLWRDRTARAETYRIMVDGRTSEVAFAPDQAIADWSSNLRSIRADTQATISPVPPFQPRTVTLRPLRVTANTSMLASLVNAGCEQQAQSLVDLAFAGAGPIQ